MAGKGITVDFNANVARFSSSVDKMTNDLAKFQTNADRISKNVNKSFVRLGSGLQTAFGGIAAAISVTELAQMADSFSNMQARLKLATRNAEEFAQANAHIARIAETSKSALDSTANLYTRIAQAMLDVGGTQQQIANTTEALALALRISGASTQESASAMQQFSQAIASGVLRGEEFNAVNEAAPRIMKALADSLGVPVGKLREMAEQGKLTRDVLVEGLGSQLPQLIKEAETLPTTISAAFTSLRNEVFKTVGEIDKLTGASQKVAEKIEMIAKGVEGWKNFITSNEQQEIVKRLEAIRFEMDAILAQRKLISNLGFDSSSFRSDALNEFNSEAQKLQRNLQKMQADSEAAGKAAAKAAEDAAALAKKRAKEIEDAAAAEKRKAEAQKAAEAAAKALADQQKTFIDSLQKEADTLGMTSAQLKVYEASLLKITGARLDGVKANVERIENFRNEKEVLESMRDSYAEATESYLRFIQATASDVKSATSKVDRLKLEISLMDKTESARNRALAQFDLEIKYEERLKELRGKNIGEGIFNIQKEALERAKAHEEEVLQFQELLDTQKKAAAETQKIWDNFGFNFQRNVGDQIYNTLNGNFKDIGTAWKSMLTRMLADAAAANLSNAIFGKDGSSGLLGSGLKILGAFLGLGGGGGGSTAGALRVTSPGSFGTAAKGAYFDSGNANFTAFAKGGIVDSPTLFKFASGGSINNGLMGEAGPEAIMPLKRDSQGRLGVAAQGGRGVSINYAPVINVDSRADRAEVHAIVSRAVKQGNADLVDKLTRQGVI